MATYYVAPSPVGNDGAGNGTNAQPWATLTKGTSMMASGDILIAKDGTYTGELNRLTPTTMPPSGPGTGTGDGRFTIIRAEHMGQAIVSHATGHCFHVSEGSPFYSWLQFDGFFFDHLASNYSAAIREAAATSSSGDSLGHHIYIRRCGAVGRGSGAGVNFIVSADDSLMEDCYVFGRCRAAFYFRCPGRRQMYRRCVVRMDDMAANNLGTSGIVFYGTRSGAAFNCISLDYDGKYVSNYQGAGAGIGARSEDADAFPASNLVWEGCVVLNHKTHLASDPTELGVVSGFSAIGTTWIVKSFQRNNVVWDMDRGYGIANSMGVTLDTSRYEHLTIGRIADTAVQNSRGTALYQLYGIPLRDSIAAFCERHGFEYCDDVDYVNVYGNGTNFYGTPTPAHYTTVNPLTNGLQYLCRIEDGSALKTAGVGGGQVGATIVKRIGVDGTFYGESGYDTLMGVDLWPWPNESIIREKMRAYTPEYIPAGESVAGPDPHRGFCADGETLTHYIWNYLGNGVPEDYGGDVAYQYAHPDADVSKGSWTASTGSDLAPMVDEADPDDADYITSAATPDHDICELRLSSIPTPAPGTVSITIRGRTL